MFQQACSLLDVDIISLDMSGRMPFNIKHTTVGMAIARGVYFEITYSGSLRDSNSRKYLISNAANLVRVTRGKNVLLSSQARRALDVRGPYDVANLCALFGMNQALGKSAVTVNPRAAILHARWYTCLAYSHRCADQQTKQILVGILSKGPSRLRNLTKKHENYIENVHQTTNKTAHGQ